MKARARMNAKELKLDYKYVHWRDDDYFWMFLFQNFHEKQTMNGIDSAFEICFFLV